MQNSHPIKTVRLFRPVESETEAEVLKEFFYFIGCLVTDHTMYNESCNFPLDTSSPPDVDLRINTNLRPEQTESPASTVQVVLHYSLKDTETEKPYAYIYNPPPLSSDSQENPEKVGQVQLEEDIIKKQITEKKKVTWQLLRRLVKLIWHKDEAAQKSLCGIVNLYMDNDLFSVLQEKRSLRVLHMTEALDWNIPLVQFQWDPYYGKMLASLQGFVDGLAAHPDNKQDNPTETVYSIYAMVNAKRKIRELMDFLKGIPEAGTKASVQETPYYSTDELLSELERLRRMDPDFSSLYFLAAYICRGSNENKIGPLDAYVYYRQFMEQQNSFGEFDAFIIDYFGTYYEKVLDDQDKADVYFRKAAQANPNCYPAIFKVARAQARKSEFAAAKEKFLLSLQLIFGEKDWTAEESWKGLSLKKLQYAFKTCIWLAKIEKAASGNLKVVNRWIGNAALAATTYQEGDFLQLYAENSQENQNPCAIDLLSYHKRSAPVEALWIMVYKWADVVGDAFLMYIADQYRQKIEKSRRDCQKLQSGPTV